MQSQPDSRILPMLADASEISLNEADGDKEAPALAASHRLGRNLFWNLGGAGAPMLAAVVCIPILVHELGTQRFGVLTIAWALIAGFGLLDFASTALTKLIAERASGDRSEEVAALFWMALLLTLAFSGILAGAFAATCPVLVHYVLKVPRALQREALDAFYLLGIALPAVTVGRMLRGVLAGFQRFDLVNYVRMPLGILAFLAPVSILPFTHNLAWVVAAITCTWVASSLVQLVLCFLVLPGLAQGPFVRLSLAKKLLGFGGWMIIFNFSIPLMVYVDRFVIGALLSMSAVAWYATPHEVVTKLYVVSAAGAGVLLPALAESLQGDRGSITRLVDWGMRYTLLVMLPLALATETFAHDGLELWLGQAFAQHATLALQWLAVGVLFNALAAVPLMLILSAHRPDVPAKFHLIEAPLYFILLYWLTYSFGINGAAAAAALMFICDSLVWFALARLLVPSSADPLKRSLWMMFGSIPAFAIAAMLPDSLALKALFLCMALGLFATWGLRNWPVPRLSGLPPRPLANASAIGVLRKLRVPSAH